ncbi:hypothetical protein ABZ960_03510 [Streptomyces pseudovenezuelae]|uniref:hypothetical protein n=1 Tax=Streptomyces pseudovenezuelae TaxID=67350 RepID=UPI0034A24967
MSMRLPLIKRVAILILASFSLYVLRNSRRTSQALPRRINGTNDSATGAVRDKKDRLDPATFREPYKIAIGAFYAICVQRAFETSIQVLDRSPLDIHFDSGGARINLAPQQIVLVCQLIAALIWMGLYYINNVRIYFLIPDQEPFRRKLTHIVLTIALAQFYFLAATIGNPTVNQLLLIIGILLADAIFPLVIGGVRSRRTRFVWVLRGTAQSTFVICILIFVPASHYTRVRWSVVMLLFMLVQFFVIAPLESHYMRKKNQIA